MLSRAIQVYDSMGDCVAGKVEISDQERRWSFKPEKNWTAGMFKLTVDRDSEDNAGNSVGRKFDVEIIEKRETPDLPATINREFRLK